MVKALELVLLSFAPYTSLKLHPFDGTCLTSSDSVAIFIIIYGLLTHEPLTYEDYQYPDWANTLGWCIAASSVLCIPSVAIYKLLFTPGTCKQRIKFLTTPWRDKQVCSNVTNDNNEVRLSPEQAGDSV